MEKVGQVALGVSGTNGESPIDTYTLSGVRWIAGEKLHCSTGNPGWCSVMTWRGAVEKGREAQEGGMCV